MKDLSIVGSLYPKTRFSLRDALAEDSCVEKIQIRVIMATETQDALCVLPAIRRGQTSMQLLVGDDDVAKLQISAVNK